MKKKTPTPKRKPMTPAEDKKYGAMIGSANRTAKEEAREMASMKKLKCGGKATKLKKGGKIGKKK